MNTGRTRESGQVCGSAAVSTTSGVMNPSAQADPTAGVVIKPGELVTAKTPLKIASRTRHRKRLPQRKQQARTAGPHPRKTGRVWTLVQCCPDGPPLQIMHSRRQACAVAGRLCQVSEPGLWRISPTHHGRCDPRDAQGGRPGELCRVYDPSPVLLGAGRTPRTVKPVRAVCRIWESSGSGPRAGGSPGT